MLAVMTTHRSCPRCESPAVAPSGTCTPCGFTQGPPVAMTPQTRVRVLDALAANDLDHAVREILTAHADGGLTIGR